MIQTQIWDLLVVIQGLEPTILYVPRFYSVAVHLQNEDGHHEASSGVTGEFQTRF